MSFSGARSSLGRVRRASHAGSWYTDNPEKLASQLDRWLHEASKGNKPARAIISPHAGYDYSGPCAGFAFNQIDPRLVKRIFVLGPAHYLSLNGKCALSGADVYDTPLYPLRIDREVYDMLKQTNEFATLSQDRDEEEHSLEMQMPYIAKVMEAYRSAFTIVPVLVGFLSPEREAAYGRIFSSFLADPENLFVISSDFCHWGRRFQYTYYDKSKGPIWQSIKSLDEQGMQIIERLASAEFTDYLKRYGNTICGRHPISILLEAINALRKRSQPAHEFDLKFLNYAQSEPCQTMDQSSVSYAAAALRIN